MPGGHSAYPHTSPSANKIAASLIKDLETIETMVPDEPETVRQTLDRAEVKSAADRSLGAGGAAVMRRVSVNIGTLQGGVKINMLPAECVLDVDFRLPVGITRAAVLDKVKAIVARYPMVTSRNCWRAIPKSTWSDPTHEMVGHLTRNAADALRLSAAADRQPRRHRHPLLAARRACLPSSMAARRPAWAASTKASASRSSITCCAYMRSRPSTIWLPAKMRCSRLAGAFPRDGKGTDAMLRADGEELAAKGGQ